MLKLVAMLLSMKVGVATNFSFENDPWNPITYAAKAQSYYHAKMAVSSIQKVRSVLCRNEGHAEGKQKPPLQPKMSWYLAASSRHHLQNMWETVSCKIRKKEAKALLQSVLQYRPKKSKNSGLLPYLQKSSSNATLPGQEGAAVLLTQVFSRLSITIQSRSSSVQPYETRGVRICSTIQSKQQVYGRRVGGWSGRGSTRRRLLARKTIAISHSKQDPNQKPEIRQVFEWLCQKMRIYRIEDLGIRFLPISSGFCEVVERSTGGIATTFSSQNDPWNPNPLLYCTNKTLKDLDLVVAHPHLPCGSKVLIWSPRTNLSVVATVADRGPRHAMLDMSEATTKKLRANGWEYVILIPEGK